MHKTIRERYHVDHAFQSEEFKEKARKTCRERHGTDNYSQSETYRQYMLDTYGTLNPRHLYKYNNIYFDSSWEITFYIYHVDKGHKIIREPKSFEYYKKDKSKHLYFPDFKVGNIYYEIKANRFIEFYKNGKPKTLKGENEKYKCMIKHNVKLIWSKQIKRY